MANTQHDLAGRAEAHDRLSTAVRACPVLNAECLHRWSSPGFAVYSVGAGGRAVENLCYAL